MEVFIAKLFDCGKPSSVSPAENIQSRPSWRSRFPPRRAAKVKVGSPRFSSCRSGASARWTYFTTSGLSVMLQQVPVHQLHMEHIAQQTDPLEPTARTISAPSSVVVSDMPASPPNVKRFDRAVTPRLPPAPAPAGKRMRDVGKHRGMAVLVAEVRAAVWRKVIWGTGSAYRSSAFSPRRAIAGSSRYSPGCAPDHTQGVDTGAAERFDGHAPFWQTAGCLRGPCRQLKNSIA